METILKIFRFKEETTSFYRQILLTEGQESGLERSQSNDKDQ